MAVRVLVIVFTCFAGMFAFGFLLAGYAALLSLNQSELEDFRRRREARRKPGLLGAIDQWSWDRQEVLPFRKIIEHWRTRPEVRRAIWLGGACLIAAVVGAVALT